VISFLRAFLVFPGYRFGSTEEPYHVILRTHHNSLRFPGVQRRSEDLCDQVVLDPCAKKYMNIDISTNKGDPRLLLAPQEMQQDSSENWYSTTLKKATTGEKTTRPAASSGNS